MKVIYQGDVGEVSRPVSSIKPSRLSYVPSRGKRLTVLLVDPRPLIRQCFLQGLEANASDLRVISAADPAEISADAVPSGAAHLVLLSIASADVTTPQAAKAIDTIEEKLPEAPIVVLSDREETDAVVAAVCRGVRGYIPTSLDLALVSGALRLVGAGGTFVPETMLQTLRERHHVQVEPPVRRDPGGAGRGSSRHFTRRQLEVLELLRRGESNKAIAYELGMQEGTAKVHVRDIMKKLQATNRTQAALLAQQLFDGHGRAAWRGPE